jgi:hypothetical protein
MSALCAQNKYINSQNSKLLLESLREKKLKNKLK